MDFTGGRPALRVPLALLGVGVLLIVVYELLAGFQVAEIGAEGDIGGGLILLLGLLLAVIGLIAVVVNLAQARRRR